MAPVTTNAAVFDSTITGANPAYATNVLGANTAWGEIKILNPAVPIQISAGNTLTLSSLNSLGIDMSQAANALTLNCPVALGANQTWLVASGLKLNVNGVVSGSSFLTINDGTAANSGMVIFGTQANTYSGGTVINGGIVQVWANAASLGTGAITNNGGILRLPSTNALSITVPLVFSGTSVLDNNLYVGGNVSLTGSWSGNGTIIISNMLRFCHHHNNGRRKLHRDDELISPARSSWRQRSAAVAPRKAPCGLTPGSHRIILAAQT